MSVSEYVQARSLPPSQYSNKVKKARNRVNSSSQSLVEKRPKCGRRKANAFRIHFTTSAIPSVERPFKDRLFHHHCSSFKLSSGGSAQNPQRPSIDSSATGNLIALLTKDAILNNTSLVQGLNCSSCKGPKILRGCGSFEAAKKYSQPTDINSKSFRINVVASNEFRQNSAGYNDALFEKHIQEELEEFLVRLERFAMIREELGRKLNELANLKAAIIRERLKNNDQRCDDLLAVFRGMLNSFFLSPLCKYERPIPRNVS